MIDFGEYYLVTIRLRNTNSFDSAIAEMQELNEWLDRLVEWQPEYYHCNVRRYGLLDIWFKYEKHAVMCILRWL
jgi:hypothetical protein